MKVCNKCKRRFRSIRRKWQSLPENFKFSKETYGHQAEFLFYQGLEVEQARYVYNKISNACKGKDYIDNFRWDVDGKFNKRYVKQLSNGCCGYYDETVKLYDGTIVRFGFNYGH